MQLTRWERDKIDAVLVERLLQIDFLVERDVPELDYWLGEQDELQMLLRRVRAARVSDSH